MVLVREFGQRHVVVSQCPSRKQLTTDLSFLDSILVRPPWTWSKQIRGTLWRDGLQGDGRPFAVGVVLESTFLMKRTNNALVLHFGRYRAARGDESGAPVADHQAHALEGAFDHGPNELLPAVHVLPHALGDVDDLATSIAVDADGGEDAGVLHVPAP